VKPHESSYGLVASMFSKTLTLSSKNIFIAIIASNFGNFTMTTSIPTRVLAGITVPDTPLITKALAFARERLTDTAYNHVVRCWLFGQFIASKIPNLQNRDEEVHAITAVLHDLGWDKTGEFVSKDKRFEVDGANAARDFLIREGDEKEWDKHRLQLVWDSIALHTTASVAMYKEAEVASCAIGVITDFTGPERSPGGVLTRGVWETVLKEFPRLDFKKGLIEVFCGLCRDKPETTYDNFVADIGKDYVEGYSVKGKRFLDILEATE